MMMPSRVAHSSAHVMTIGSIDDESQRNPCSISQQRAFDSLLAAIGGILAGRGVSERGFGHRSISCLPLPLNARQLIVSTESCLPEGFEEACPFPFLKAIMDRRGGAQFSWQGIPLDACAQDIDHRFKCLTVWHAWTPSFGMRRGL